jgi:hypothetical protein
MRWIINVLVGYSTDTGCMEFLLIDVVMVHKKQKAGSGTVTKRNETRTNERTKEAGIHTYTLDRSNSDTPLRW